MTKRKSQHDRIAAHLIKGHRLTPLSALERFGCLRLGARIHELRENGLPVKSEMITLPSGKRVARYWL